MRIGVEQELVGRKGNIGKTSNSVEVYFHPFQFLFKPQMRMRKVIFQTLTNIWMRIWTVTRKIMS